MRAFEAFVVSGGNSLVSSKMLRTPGKEDASGILSAWWREFTAGDALNKPLAQIFPLQEPPAIEADAAKPATSLTTSAKP